MEPVEHEGIGHPDEWRPGYHQDCDDCRIELEALHIRRAGTGPNWAIHWLKDSNASGHTANEIRQDIYDSARKDGRDITRA